jgi:hypothetical protein
MLTVPRTADHPGTTVGVSIFVVAFGGREAEDHGDLIACVQDLDDMSFNFDSAFERELLDSAVPESVCDRALLGGYRISDNPLLEAERRGPAGHNIRLKSPERVGFKRKVRDLVLSLAAKLLHQWFDGGPEFLLVNFGQRISRRFFRMQTV